MKQEDDCAGVGLLNGCGSDKMQKNGNNLPNYLQNSNNFRIFVVENKNRQVMPSAEVRHIIPQIQQFLKTQPVERAYLFGSCSRGEETPNSDIDLLVTYTDSDSLSLMDISRMMVQLGKKINRRVDMVEDACLKPFARESVNHDKIMIYERAH